MTQEDIKYFKLNWERSTFADFGSKLMSQKHLLSDAEKKYYRFWIEKDKSRFSTTDLTDIILLLENFAPNDSDFLEESQSLLESAKDALSKKLNTD